MIEKVFGKIIIIIIVVLVVNVLIRKLVHMKYLMPTENLVDAYKTKNSL